MFLISALPVRATNYFLSPIGSDANSGQSIILPWLTPNHALNCGDIITAASSSAYVATNFRPGKWGVVTCPSGNNVAWLQCQVFDTCKIIINSLGHNAMTPTQSYWGIQGWEVTVTTFSGNQCFEAFPPDFTHTIHHIIFANNVANGCGDGAFTTGASANGVGVDYVAIIGNVAFNGAQDPTNCYSGIDVVVPVNSDTLPGTHYYIAGNFSWGNVNPNPCSNGQPTDGQGISLDTVNGNKYTGQILIDNNVSVFNGGTAIQSFLNTGGTPNAPIYIRHNTAGFNQTGAINAFPCAEINLNSSLSTQVTLNLVETGAATGCKSVGIFALGVTAPDATDILTNNYLFSAAGNNTTGSGTGFSFGSNTTGTDPKFANPVQPPAPSCGNFASVPACMAQVVANFTPTTLAAQSFGYQMPSAAPVSDVLFPAWLCSVTNLPPGLITMGCAASTSTYVIATPVYRDYSSMLVSGSVNGQAVSVILNINAATQLAALPTSSAAQQAIIQIMLQALAPVVVPATPQLTPVLKNVAGTVVQ